MAQVIGPLVVSGVAHLRGGFAAALIAATTVLLLAAFALWRSTVRAAQPAG